MACRLVSNYIVWLVLLMRWTHEKHNAMLTNNNQTSSILGEEIVTLKSCLLEQHHDHVIHAKQ